jgi:hypothetical protein
MTPRARPKAKAPVGPSPGLAFTLSTKAAVAWLANMIETSNGALTGQKKAVAIAVKNVSGRRRWSKLREWLNPV